MARTKQTARARAGQAPGQGGGDAIMWQLPTGPPMRGDAFVQDPEKYYVPENRCARNIRYMFDDEETSDIVFAVDSTRYHAHMLIIKMNAPEFAELYFPAGVTTSSEEEEGKNLVRVEGVESASLFYVLKYIYGHEIPGDVYEYDRLAYPIIKAANKLGGLDSLKAEAEAHYVRSTPITLQNFEENYHFADNMMCPLLKETVMDFAVRNEEALLDRFKSCKPPESSSMFTDLLTAKRRLDKTDCCYDLDPQTISVNVVRRLLDASGLPIGGNREMLMNVFERAWVPMNSICVGGADVPEINGRYIFYGRIRGAPAFGRTVTFQGEVVTFTVTRATLHDRDRSNRWFITIINDRGPFRYSNNHCAFYYAPEPKPEDQEVYFPPSRAHWNACPPTYGWTRAIGLGGGTPDYPAGVYQGAPKIAVDDEGQERWFCDKCNHAKFKTYDEARGHEDRCQGLIEMLSESD